MFKVNFNFRIKNLLCIVAILIFSKCNYEKRESKLFGISLDIKQHVYNFKKSTKICFFKKINDTKWKSKSKYFEKQSDNLCLPFMQLICSIQIELVLSVESLKNKLILLELMLLDYKEITENCFLYLYIFDKMIFDIEKNIQTGYYIFYINEIKAALKLQESIKLYLSENYKIHETQLLNDQYQTCKDILSLKEEEITIGTIKEFLSKNPYFGIMRHKDPEDQEYKKYLISQLSTSEHFYPISDYLNAIYDKDCIFYDLAIWYSDFNEAVHKDHYKNELQQITLVSIKPLYSGVYNKISKNYYMQGQTNTCFYNSISRALAFLYYPDDFLNKNNHRAFLLEALKKRNEDDIMEILKNFDINNYKDETSKETYFLRRAHKILNNLKFKKTMEQIRLLDKDKNTNYDEDHVKSIIKNLIELSKKNYANHWVGIENDDAIFSKMNCCGNKTLEKEFDGIINLLCPNGPPFSNNSIFNAMKDYVETVTFGKYTLETFSTYDFKEFVEEIKKYLSSPLLLSFIGNYDPESKSEFRHAMMLIAYEVNPKNQEVLGFWVLNTWWNSKNGPDSYFGYYSYENFRKSLFSMGKYTFAKFVEINKY